MPIYEYRCEACGHQQEFLQKVSDPTLTVCPACGKATFTKMLTAAGFQLKGSGWYATDFKNKGAAPSAKTEGKSGEKASGEAKAEGTKSEGTKSEGTKSEGAKSEGAKSEGPSSPTPSSGSAAPS